MKLIYIAKRRAAEILGITTPTLDYYVKCGYLTTVKVRGVTYITLQHLLDFKNNVTSEEPLTPQQTPTKEEIHRHKKLINKQIVEEKNRELAEKLTRGMGLVIDGKIPGEHLLTTMAKLEHDTATKLKDLADRIAFLEDTIGTLNKESGLALPALHALKQEALRVADRNMEIDPEERTRWIYAIEAMDYPTVQLCLKTKGLTLLPAWMIRVGIKMAEDAKSTERTRALVATRALRLLLSGFTPIKMPIRCEFPAPEWLSPIDALIVASVSY